MSEATFLKRLREKVVVADGAMGTTIQTHQLAPDDFEGVGICNEFLVHTRPELIRQIHADYLQMGADLVETNSFGSASLTLANYGLAGRAYELSRRAAELARSVVDQFYSPMWPRFVSGCVGPGCRLPSLGQITYEALFDSYTPQMLGLIDGGVDLIQIETCQDVLQVKCAVSAAISSMQQLSRRVPICVTMTVDRMGKMPVKTKGEGAMTDLETLPIDIIGFNCVTGSDMMQENVRHFCALSPKPVAVLLNAGLPHFSGEKALYDLSPKAFADYHEIFIKEYNAVMVGGCCGTNPAHIKELHDRLTDLTPNETKTP